MLHGWRLSKKRFSINWDTIIKKKALNCRNLGPQKKTALKQKTMMKCDRIFSPKTTQKFAKIFFKNREFVTKYYLNFVLRD
jgi:hypothetical protein